MRDQYSPVLPLFISICLGLTSCSKDEVDKENPSSIKISISDKRVEPFQPITAKVDTPKEEILQSYDSLVWIANGVASRYWNSLAEVGARYIIGRNITDYVVGKHKLYVIGYKNGNIISKDSSEYDIKKPSGDFLSMKWGGSDKDECLTFRTGTTPVNYNPIKGVKGIELNLHRIIQKTQKEYLLLEYVPWIFKNADAWIEEDTRENIYTLFHNYITSIYGKSTYVYTGGDIKKTNLWSEYNKLFQYQPQIQYPLYTESYPVEIWETPTASICLFAAANNWYYVIAEAK